MSLAKKKIELDGGIFTQITGDFAEVFVANDSSELYFSASPELLALLIEEFGSMGSVFARAICIDQGGVEGQERSRTCTYSSVDGSPVAVNYKDGETLRDVITVTGPSIENRDRYLFETSENFRNRIRNGMAE